MLLLLSARRFVDVVRGEERRTDVRWRVSVAIGALADLESVVNYCPWSARVLLWGPHCIPLRIP